MLPTQQPRRWDAIDTLRGLSIVLVVLHHVNLHLRSAHLDWQSQMPKGLGRVLFWNGANGVLVFFAISGFLITSMARRRWGSLSRPNLKQFYRLRAARILPLLVALMIALSALHLMGAHGFTIRPNQCSLGRAVLAALTFHVNYLEAAVGYLPANWDVLWSLAVEEVFYLFFPLLCLTLRRERWIVLGLGVFVVLGPFMRVHYGDGLWAEYGYLCRMDAIAFGCLAAIAAPRLRARPGLTRALGLAGAAMMFFILFAVRFWRVFPMMPGFFHWSLDDSVLPLGTALVLLAVSQRNLPGPRMLAPLRWFGRNSYEVYLTHMFVATWGIQLYQASGIGARWSAAVNLGILLVAGLLGAAVARWYSEPANRRLRGLPAGGSIPENAK